MYSTSSSSMASVNVSNLCNVSRPCYVESWLPLLCKTVVSFVVWDFLWNLDCLCSMRDVWLFQLMRGLCTPPLCETYVSVDHFRYVRSFYPRLVVLIDHFDYVRPLLLYFVASAMWSSMLPLFRIFVISVDRFCYAWSLSILLRKIVVGSVLCDFSRFSAA